MESDPIYFFSTQTRPRLYLFSNARYKSTMTEDTTSKLAFLFLGWLLGLLGPIIVDQIRRARENKLGREAIKQELASLHVKLIYAAHTIEEHFGTMDRAGLTWITQQLDMHKNDDEVMKICATFKKELELTDAQLSSFLATRKSPKGTSLTLQKYATPLLDSRVTALWSFRTNDQRSLLEIRGVLDIISDAVDRCRYFSNLTFSKLENGNYDLAVKNVSGCYTQYAEQAKIAAKMIGRFYGSNQ